MMTWRRMTDFERRKENHFQHIKEVWFVKQTLSIDCMNIYREDDTDFWKNKDYSSSSLHYISFLNEMSAIKADQDELDLVPE